MLRSRFGRSLQLSLGLAVTGAAMVMTAGAASAAAQTVTVSPSTGLKDAQSVSVTASGFPAGLNVFVIECSNFDANSVGCDIPHAKPETVPASGTFTTSFVVHTGAIGNGTCTAASTTCYIAVGDSGKTAGGFMTIKFGSAPAPTSSAPTSSAPTSSAPTSSAPTSSAPTSSTPPASGPTAVAAGTGGLADHRGPVVPLVLLVSVGAVMLVGGTGLVLYRRR